MSLLTLERSSPSPHESEIDDLSTSSYEGFVAREHYAMCLTPRPITSLGPSRRGEHMRIFSHLKKLVKLLRPEDMLKLAVELDNGMPRKVTKYMVVIITHGNQDTEETVVLGTEQEGSLIRLGLVLPLWRDTEIKLDGDGGFSIHTDDRQHVFKPLSVQSMWTALQTLYKCTEHARVNNYYVGGLSHTWMTYYKAKLTQDVAILSEWNLEEDVVSFRPDSLIYSSDIVDRTEGTVVFEKLLSHKLRSIMLEQDLEEITCKQLRTLVEKEMKQDLTDYKEFLDHQMLRILGQMERPSQIYEYLYLGSEWNASNLSELKDLGVKYILNITREIDNFYPEEFKYLNVRLYDVPASELMKHWDKTYKFIKEAKLSGKKALVHCKMGISRSASTVMAYMMKEYNMSLEEALVYVKGKRSIVHPNDGFMQQLKDYEGILKARHNDLWGKKAPSRLHPLQESRKLFHSEPNLLDCGHDQSCTIKPDLSLLPEEDHTILNAPSSSQWTSSSQYQSLAIFPPSRSIPVDKHENIRTFLASLPPVVTIDDDQGIGENLYNSESGSGFSTPNLSPTDDDQFNIIIKLGKEIHKRKRSGSLDSDSKRFYITENQTNESPIVFNTGMKTKGQISSEGVSKENTVPSETQTMNELSACPNQLKPRAASCDSLIANIMAEQWQPKTQSGAIMFAIQNVDSDFTSQFEVMGPSSMSPNASVSSWSPSPSDDLTQNQPNIFADNIVSKDTLNSPEPSSHFGCTHPEAKSESIFEETDLPDPVSIPQIQSVPMRIKEIEELHSKPSNNETIQSDTQSTSDQNCSGSKAQPSQTLQIISRNSSVNSLLYAESKQSCSCDEELKQLVPVPNESSTSRLVATRHESLSPSPPSISKLSEHVRHSSLTGLPSTLSKTDTDARPQSISTLQSGPSTSNEVVTSVGAVKARVLHIEEKNVRKYSVTSDKSDTSLRSSSPGCIKRLNDQLPQKLSGVDIDSVEFSGDIVVTVSSQSNVNNKTSTTSAEDALLPELGSHHSVSHKESIPPAVFSAWSNWISAPDIPPPPVQDLKRKFEETDSGNESRLPEQHTLKRSQSLRTVETPKAVAPRPGTSSPNQMP